MGKRSCQYSTADENSAGTSNINGNFSEKYVSGNYKLCDAICSKLCYKSKTLKCYHDSMIPEVKEMFSRPKFDFEDL